MLDMPPVAALDTYLMIGGFPRLAALWRHGESVWQFLKRELADPTTSLAVIGERSVNAEFPADIQARQVLEAIGSGERAYGAIAQRSGVPATSLNRALKTLQDKGVILKMAPYSSKRSAKNPRYIVVDPYLRFWLRFINPNAELILRGRGDVVLSRIREAWPTYRGRAIEPLVREAIERMLPDQLFGNARFVGSYWTRDNRTEIDLVGGFDEEGSDAIDFVGSIKWKESGAFDRADFATLAAHRTDVPGASSHTRLVGISRSGFSTDGLDVAIGPDELIGVWSR